MIDYMFENGKITLSIIKPDAVQKGYAAPILSKIVYEGFHIIALKMMELSQKSAKKFYIEHNQKLFFKSLVRFMSSGPIVSVMLEKENAVKDFRILMGDTNPIYAKKGTIRNLYASSLEKNAIHGSDSNKNAFKESFFYFSNMEIFLKKICN
ncbi:nucleoside-diphosphate kinase [Blattabacterium cuenoti]|uniref:nucleoside-diphosphate kinase n=1 Tax=Blattabacterium cuenoti TaxID=1653831 RepID=UPI00163C65D9|nr:nucleoside-diphosphate kinase [Blattabacterium cuenoti]